MAHKVLPKPLALTWQHFKPVAVIPGSDEEAQVAPEAVFGKTAIQKVGGKFRLGDFTVLVGLKSSETLVLRTADKTDDLLEHEQGHYELMILSARAMAAELDQLEAESADDLRSKVADVQAVHGTRAEALDKKYDTQTDHSRNVAQQRRWRKLIDEALVKGNASSIDGNEL
jgi:hypothetical protein